MIDEQVIEWAQSYAKMPSCSDHDADCDGIENKVGCYLYDPARGMCPYLRARMKGEGS